MINRILAAFAALALIALTGCHKNFYDVPDYVGTWNSGSNTVIFGSNNTYSVSFASALVSSGKYSATQNVLDLTGTAGACYDSVPATYTYTYTVTSLNGTFTRNLTLVADVDSCTARVAVMPGTYAMPKQ